MTQTFVELCQLFGIDLTVAPQSKENSFPKIKNITFNNKIYSPLELFESLQIEQKIKQFNENNYLNKNQNSILITSSNVSGAYSGSEAENG